MTFHHVRLPIYISFESIGGLEFLTEITETDNDETRGKRRSQPPYRGFIPFNALDNEMQKELTSFHYCRQGKLYGFRFQDRLNHQAVMDVIDANYAGSGSLFLLRNYQSGPYSFSRKIYFPALDLSPVQLFVNNEWFAPSNFSWNASTKKIDFVTPPAAGSEISWSGYFDEGVRFDTDWRDLRTMEPDVYSWGFEIIGLKSAEALAA